MYEVLTELQTKLGIEIPNLLEAASFSKKTLEEVRASALSYLVENHILRHDHKNEGLELGLVAFGSLARQELSSAPDTSDFDHAIVAYRAIEQPEDIQQYRLAALKAQTVANLGDPGQSRLFGGVVSASDLVNRIGLEDDTNRSHTQRLLFLEESVPIIDSPSHLMTLQSILKRYLSDYRNHESGERFQKEGVPRFLLNDVVRYWRTIAVDYQAKRWDELALPADFYQTPVTGAGDAAQPMRENPKWGLRYIKLRSTRKLAFAGTVVSLFIPRILQCRTDDVLLVDQFSRPSLARLAQLRAYLCESDQEILGEIFEIADAFMSSLNDAEFRSEVSKVRHPRDPEGNTAFIDARARTQVLEAKLESLFCSRNALVCDAKPLDGDDVPLSLGSLTTRYLLF